MLYINPIELLDLTTLQVEEITPEIIKKSKRKLFAEIELSDSNIIEYHGVQLTQSDCERSIEDLESKNNLEFYHHLVKNLELNNFLAEGDPKHLVSIKQESIYNLPEFKNFLGPFISVKMNTALLRAFIEQEIDAFLVIFKIDHLVDKKYLNQTFSSLGGEIQQRISEVEKLTKEIRDESKVYNSNTITEVTTLVKNLFPIQLINLLPNYFQSQINKIASSLNYLQLTLWNQFNITEPSVIILEHVLELNIESVSKPTFEKNYAIVSKKHKERIEQEKNAPLLKYWAELLVYLKDALESYDDDGVHNSKSLLERVRATFDNQTNKEGKILNSESTESVQTRLYWLNNLPDFANEIRNQFGLTIRSMSISIWNKDSDINTALILIGIAQKIKLTEDIKEKIKGDENQLLELKEKYKGLLTCHFCGKHTPDSNAEVRIPVYKETNRSYFPSRVEYSYLTVSIPRCKSCNEIHSGKRTEALVLFFGIFLAGIAVGGIMENAVVGAMVGGLIGFFAKIIYENKENSKSGVKSLSYSSYKEFQLIQDKLKQGWSFDKPTA